MDMIPDNEYFHSMFGSDKEKCPAWFAVGWAICMMIVYRTIGLILVSIIF